jgi:hypothetical protein
MNPDLRDLKIYGSYKVPKRNTGLPNSCLGQMSYLWTYDLYGPVRNALAAGRYITRASGRGVGPWNREFFGGTVNLNHKTYWKSTANCNILKGMLWSTKS